MECVTFGQPRVGDAAFRKGLDEASPQLSYLRVVRGGDLFARVPTSGFWLPGTNGGKFEVGLVNTTCAVVKTHPIDDNLCCRASGASRVSTAT